MSDTKKNRDDNSEIFVTELEINKVRHLENITIPLSTTERKHLILTGKNGSGKTSVLHFLIGLMEGHADRKESNNFLIIGEGGSIQCRIKYPNPAKGTYLWDRMILTFYGAKRLVEMRIPIGINKVELKDKYQYGVDSGPAKDFIQHIVNLKAERSFARDDKDASTVEKIDQWFEIFEKGLKEIFEDQSLRLEFDRKKFNFTIHQRGKEPFDFTTLADGYSAIISIVTDLMMRMEKNKTNAYDVQGIVLIDELEAHLHIDLQKKILPFLTSFFPRVQFIVTTHSPFILNSIENAVIYDLEKQLLVDDLSGYAYDGIVEGYYGNDMYSQLVKDKLAEYERLVDQQELSEEEETERHELRRYLKQIPDWFAEELKLEFKRIELKRKG